MSNQLPDRRWIEAINTVMRTFYTLCIFDIHYPPASRSSKGKRIAEWDGISFVSKCRFCRKNIRRQVHGGWKIDSERHVFGVKDNKIQKCDVDDSEY